MLMIDVQTQTDRPGPCDYVTSTSLERSADAAKRGFGWLRPLFIFFGADRDFVLRCLASLRRVLEAGVTIPRTGLYRSSEQQRQEFKSGQQPLKQTMGMISCFETLAMTRALTGNGGPKHKISPAPPLGSNVRQQGERLSKADSSIV